MNAKVFGAVSLFVVLLLGVELAEAASTGLPDPDDATIVASRSLGGVAIGDDLGEANRAWGGTGRCQRGVCTYGNYSSKKGVARIVRTDGEVSEVKIAAGVGPAPDDRVGATFEGPLLDFRMEKGGVGLGSKLGELRKAYPRAESTPGLGRGFTLGGKGDLVMTFATYRSEEHRITEIQLLSEPER